MNLKKQNRAPKSEEQISPPSLKPFVKVGIFNSLSPHPHQTWLGTQNTSEEHQTPNHEKGEKNFPGQKDYLPFSPASTPTAQNCKTCFTKLK